MSNLLFPLSAITGAYIDERAPYHKWSTDEALGGNELRSTWWLSGRTRYKVKVEVARSDLRKDYQILQDFAARHFDGLDSFLLQDPEDSLATDMGFGLGDGATVGFQLQRSLLGTFYDRLGGPWSSLSKPRTNYLTWSQDFTNAAWVKVNMTPTANAALAPDGTKTANLLNEGVATGLHNASHAPSANSITGEYRAYSVFLKDNGIGKVQVLVGGSLAFLNVNLATGAIVSSGGGTSTLIASGITPVPGIGGWYRVWLITLTGATPETSLFVSGTDAAFATSYTGTSRLFYSWGADVETVSSTTTVPPAYNATAAAVVTVNPNYWPIYSDAFRPVYELAGDTQIFVNGVLKTLVTDYTLPGLGAVTFNAAPAVNAVLSWTGTYFYRVRWDEPRGVVWKRIALNMWSTELNLISLKPSL